MQKAAFRFLASACLSVAVLTAPPFSAQNSVSQEIGLTAAAEVLPSSSNVSTADTATAAAVTPIVSDDDAFIIMAEPVPQETPAESTSSEEPVSQEAPAESIASEEPVQQEAPAESIASEEPVQQETPAESAASEEPVQQETPAESAASEEPAPQETPSGSGIIYQTYTSNAGDLYYRGVRRMLDSIPLQPMASTGNYDLDAKLDAIFASILTDNMDTHDKLKACYDYLIGNIYYKTSSWSELDPSDIYSSGYNYAYHLLKVGYGVCDSYSAAFAVMARRLGLPAYTVRGTTSAGGGGYIDDHVWCQIDYEGVSYIFDPQVEDNIARSKGYTMYIRFGGTTSQLSDCYWGGSLLCDYAKTCKDPYFE